MNWEAFLNDNNIEYVDYGPNVKTGNININCPWCMDDPSHHMGISLNDDAYGCWRDATHRGKKVERLVQALLGCSYNQAKLVARQYSVSDPSTLDDALATLMGTDTAPKQASQGIQHTITLPKNFRRIEKHGTTSKFWRYLRLRGVDDVRSFSDFYKIRCCMTGHWKDRIIFPIYYESNLVTWTSRMIAHSDVAPRYMTYSRDDGATMSIKDTLYNFDTIRDDPADILFLTEGPIDALMVDWYGWHHGARATCFFSAQMTLIQASLVKELIQHYKKVILLFDKDTTKQTFEVLNILGTYGVTAHFLEEVDDPGSMSPKQIKELTKMYL